jgi:transcriptional regulator with XRE-family HTH domain
MTETPLGRWLKRQIEERGLSVRAAAIYAGLTDPTLLRVMKTGRASSETCRKLADYFNADPDYVLALAGHRELKTPWEEEQEFPPDVVELMDVVASLSPELREEAMKIIRHIVDGFENVRTHYVEEEEEELERVGRRAA